MNNTNNVTDLEIVNRKRLEKEKLSDDDVDMLYYIMEMTDKILNDNKIRYSIEGGTMLGAVRNGGLIPHDNDGDFDILESDIKKVLSLKNDFMKYNLLIIITPGWGLQISHKDSPNLAKGLWSMKLEDLDNLDSDYKNYDPNIELKIINNINVAKWTSKWPFLDLISIQKHNNNENKYVCAQDVALNDYPNYYITSDEWDNEFERVDFGHLKLWAIAKHTNRINYLDRNYPFWNNIIEMVMDHRENVYFDQPIRCSFTDTDKTYRKCSKYIDM